MKKTNFRFTSFYLNAVGVDIEARDRMAASDEISGHVSAHVAKSDKSDAGQSSGTAIRRQSPSRDGQGGGGGDQG